MLEKFRQLNEREQVLLLGLGALLGLMIIFYAVVSPVLSLRTNAAADYARAERLAAMTDGLEAPGEESEEDRALRLVVTELADRGALVYTRINQDPEGGLQMDLDDVPYAAFYRWLRTLAEEEGVVVSEAYVTAGDTAGTLDARVSLVRAN